MCHVVNKIFFFLVIIGVPLSVAGSLLHWSQILMFVVYCLTIVSLAAYMGRATESLAVISG
ncbi:cation transporter, partial [Staphylococcus sp. SIMBA_130]